MLARKHFYVVESVATFMASMPLDVRGEYGTIIAKLEHEGRLVAPFGEKVEPGLFAIRVIRAGNVRIFYAYGRGDAIYGLHAYVKKTQKIPMKELEQARRVARSLERQGLT